MQTSVSREIGYCFCINVTDFLYLNIDLYATQVCRKLEHVHFPNRCMSILRHTTEPVSGHDTFF